MQIDIPVIGTHARVVPLGLDADGAMEAPVDPDTVGWYQPGVGIGAPGNTLLDGHVDWVGQLRVFGYLRLLTPGDAIYVTDDQDQVLTYDVLWTKLYDVGDAPVDEIFGPTGEDEVTLITCGGAFDRSTRTYESRWVVRAARDPSV